MKHSITITFDDAQPIKSAAQQHAPALFVAAAITPEGVRLVLLDLGAAPHRSQAASVITIAVERVQYAEPIDTTGEVVSYASAA